METMKTSDAIKHFGSVIKLAEALQITRHAVYLWGDNVPCGRAFQIQVLTNGALVANSQEYPERYAEPEAA